MDLNRIKADEGHRLRLRLVQPEDAGYIHALRTDPRYNSYLSAVTGGAADQRQWIQDYKTREAIGSELYYVIERLADGARCGVVRLYEITDESFTWGSWVLDHNKPAKAALECALLIYRIGLDLIGCPKAVFEVMNENAHTLAFHRRMGATETGADAQNTYFTIAGADFDARKDLLWDAVKQQSKPAEPL